MEEPINSIDILQEHFSDQGSMDINIIARYLQEEKGFDEDTAFEMAMDTDAEAESEEEINKFWIWYEKNYYLSSLNEAE